MHRVYAIVGPPASGKSSIIRELLQYPGVGTLISHTTRKPQPDEIDGLHYYFVDKEQFVSLTMVEKVTYAKHFYGLSKQEVLSKVKQQPISVVEMDADGYEQLKRLLGDAVKSIYILVDKDTIIARSLLLENQEEIRRRVEYAEAAGEFNNWKWADYVVKNTGEFAAVMRQIAAIIGLPPR